MSSKVFLKMIFLNLILLCLDIIFNFTGLLHVYYFFQFGVFMGFVLNACMFVCLYVFLVIFLYSFFVFILFSLFVF